jgi:hypothetical protein
MEGEVSAAAVMAMAEAAMGGPGMRSLRSDGWLGAENATSAAQSAASSGAVASGWQQDRDRDSTPGLNSQILKTASIKKKLASGHVEVETESESEWESPDVTRSRRTGVSSGGVNLNSRILNAFRKSDDKNRNIP